MNLSDIDVQKIKNMDDTQMKELAERIKSFMLQNDNKESKLSSIAISLALIKEFDLDEDKLIFENDDLKSAYELIRKDTISCGSISKALGMASARDLKDKNHHVISIINQNSFMNEGNIEALYQLGQDKRKMIVIYNDTRGKDKGINIIDKIVMNITNAYTYNQIKDYIKDILRPQKFGGEIIEYIRRFKAEIKKKMLDEGILSDLGIEYIGPIEADDLQMIKRSLEVVKKKDYPCIVHCVHMKTENGIVDQQEIKIDKKLFLRNDDVMKSTVDDPNYIETPRLISETLSKLMNKDESISIIVSSIERSGMNYVFTKNRDKCFEFNTTNSEMLSFACGLAESGMKPFVCLDSLSDCHAQIDYINANKLPIIIGLNKEKDDEIDLKYFEQFNYFCILEGKCCNEISSLLNSAFTYEMPIVFRYNNSTIRRENDDLSQINLGEEEIIANNDIDTYIIAKGFDFMSLHRIVKENEIRCNLINMRFINPIGQHTYDVLEDKNVYVYNSEFIYKKLKNVLKTKELYNVNGDIREMISKIEEIC